MKNMKITIENACYASPSYMRIFIYFGTETEYRKAVEDRTFFASGGGWLAHVIYRDNPEPYRQQLVNIAGEVALEHLMMLEAAGEHPVDIEGVGMSFPALPETDSAAIGGYYVFTKRDDGGAA